MKIAFDGKRAVQNFTGLGNYSRLIIDLLYQAAPGNQYIVCAPRCQQSMQMDRLIAHCPRLSWRYPHGRWSHMGTLWRSWGVTETIRQEHVDISHGLSGELPLNIRRARETRSVVTVHDLIFLRHPEYYSPIDCRLYEYKMHRACDIADHIIAISECTKRDIIHYFHTNESKIEVIYQGCDQAFSQPISQQQLDDVKRRLSLPDKYILYVGTIEARKNVLQAVEAMASLPEDIHLIIVGRATPYVLQVKEAIHNLHLSHRVSIRQNVPFSDLPSIYRMAAAFVYPSRYEGFGIPILEAIESGVPVVAATGSCLEEAGGPDTQYVDPDDVSAMETALKRILSPAYPKAEHVARAQQWAQQFSSQRQAEQILRVYDQLLRQ